MKTKLFFSTSTINNNFRFFIHNILKLKVPGLWTVLHDQSNNEETILPSEMSYNSLHFCQSYRLIVNKTDP